MGNCVHCGIRIGFWRVPPKEKKKPGRPDFWAMNPTQRKTYLERRRQVLGELEAWFTQEDTLFREWRDQASNNNGTLVGVNAAGAASLI